jgi:murein DD-endopeptidase MepM/ murein hydrolase activator NlpD
MISLTKPAMRSFKMSVPRAWAQRFDSPALSVQRAWAILVAALLLSATALGENSSSIPNSQGVYRWPYADDTQVKVFADFITHTPRGRLDLYAVGEEGTHRVVASASGRLVAIQDSYSEQEDGRTAPVCHNNYVWIEHPNGEWTNYSHLAKDSVTKKARLKVGDEVNAGQYIGDEGAVGCAMFKHVHFEVGIPDKQHPIDSSGFLTDNDNGKRELNPRFCGARQNAVKDQSYIAVPCR